MEPPRVNPVGVVEQPEGYVVGPRALSLRHRVAAGIVLASFLAVVLVTTALSAGRYCLTSEASSPSPLHGRAAP